MVELAAVTIAAFSILLPLFAFVVLHFLTLIVNEENNNGVSKES